MIIRNKMKLTAISKNCQVADKFFTRFIGLIGKKNIADEYALIISPCNSIHMFFMKFSLDIIFIDKNNRVVHLIEGIKPWRFSKIVGASNSVIELSTNSIKRSRTEIGDILEFI